MKQLGKGSQSIALHGVLLYLEDFLSIVELFRENCDVVEVTADGFGLDDPETEISQLKGRLNRLDVFDLEIAGYQLNPVDAAAMGLDRRHLIKHPATARLSLSDGYGRLSYDADDSKAKGLSSWIQERLRHRRVTKLLGEKPWLNVFVGIVFIPLFLAPEFLFGYLLPISRIMSGILAGIWGLLILFWLGSRIFRKKPVAVLRLENRPQRTNFFLRNRDQLVLLVITNLLTAGLTLGVTLLVQSLKFPTETKPGPTTVQSTK